MNEKCRKFLEFRFCQLVGIDLFGEKWAELPPDGELRNGNEKSLRSVG